MAELCQVNEAVPFHFSIFEADGRAKKSGLVAADFSTRLKKNNIVQSQATIDLVLTAVSEISAPSGDYGITSTFPSLGRWRLEISYGEGDQMIEEMFQVVPVFPWNMPRGRTT